MRFPRLTPSFAVAVLALVVASGGAGFAAGKITSAQIKDGTIQGRDVRDRSLTGADVRPNSLPRDRTNKACPTGHSRAFGGCVRRVPYSRATYAAAADRCNRLNGRLPTLQELKWIADHDEFTWANGANNQYEHSATYTDSPPFTPMGFDRSFTAAFTNSGPQPFWYHCITY